VTVETGVGVTALARRGAGFAVTTADGRTLEVPVVALAIDPGAAASLLRPGFGELASRLSRVGSATVDSLGLVLPRARAWMPECAFLVPVDDLFFSCVTRDPFPDPRFRAFAFHFRPGLTRAERLGRALEVLRVGEADLLHLAERSCTLPSPALGHGSLVADLDQHLAGSRLALTGNYFDGLAIEDCVGRSFAEWTRVAAAGG
jgi:UDP-galactopyranose mutase